jgi:pimeloyl-ACP methyl ester carboxylesterase
MKKVGRLVAGLVLLGLAAAAVFYERPLWVNLQMVHLRLFAARVQSNYVMTPEGRVHYYEAEPRVMGGGVPLVLVHGLGDRAEAWEPMIVRLKRAGFHVYALDLLGYGRSPKPSDSDYSISTQEKLVVDFIQALGLQRTDLGGWSMGGWVTLKLALDHPELLNRVVVYDAAGMTRFQPAFGPDIFHPTDAAGLRRLALLLEPNAKPLPGFVAKDALRKFAGEQWVIDRGMAAMIGRKDAIDDRMSSFQPPLLIVWGSDDRLLPLSLGQQMQRLDPKAELDVVEGCGHLEPSGCAGRAAAATAQFLQANPAPEGGLRTLTK